MSAPLVTVVTICRNAGRDLELTLQSVANQTRRADFEHVVVDGASTDGTLELLQRNPYSVDAWVSEPDRGIADAFNKGVRMARGEWIVFMNAGDRFADPDAAARSAPHLRAGPDIVYGQCAMHAADGQLLGTLGRPFSPRALRARMTLPHQSIFHARSLFDMVGLYDERFKVAMDYDLLLRRGSSLRAEYFGEVIAIQQAGGVSQSDEPRTYVEYRQAQIQNGIPKPEANCYFAWFMFKHYSKVTLRRMRLDSLVRRLRAVDF